MQHRIHLLFLLIFLFGASSANQVLACGDKGGQCCSERTEKSCCGEENDAVNAAQSDDSDACNEHQPCKPCDKDGKGRDCHCPGSSSVTCGFALALLAEAFPLLDTFATSDDLNRQAFYFAEHLPESVCLPIWQPPQLAV